MFIRIYTVIYTAVCCVYVCTLYMRTTLVLFLVAIIYCVKQANMKSEYFLYVQYKIRSSKNRFPISGDVDRHAVLIKSHFGVHISNIFFMNPCLLKPSFDFLKRITGFL